MEKLNCHCGQIEIEVNLTKGLEDLYRCNCSMCKRKGAISTVIDKKDLKVTKGEELLKFYQFNTNVAKHYFCTNCGIYTHNQRRADPNTYGINVGCLNGITEDELFKFKVRINDGHNHILDRKKIMIKKLKCHCGNVEAEVNIPDNGIEKNNEMQLFYL